MNEMLTALGAGVAALLPITNPVGAVAAFAALTDGDSPANLRRQAWRTGMWVAGILLVFAALGSVLLNALGITLPALQIGGGLVVAYSGFGMITPRQGLTDAESTHAAAKPNVSFSPMALPLVAGPGAIGVVIALCARDPGLASRAGVMVAVVLVAVLVAAVLRWGTPVVDRLGPTGIGALVRVMGFLILVIGVELVIHGVQALTA